MILRIIEMLIGNLFVTIVTIRLFRVLRSKAIHLDIAIFGFLWIYTAIFYTLILGILGLLESHRIAIISGTGLFFFIPSIYRIVKRPFLTNPFSGFAFTRPHISIMVILLCLLGFLQLARILFHIWFVPPYVWDTVVYHLVNVAEWVQKGKIYPVITPVGRVYWPASFEALEAWFVVFLHHDLLVKVAPFLCYLVTGASAYAIARILNLSRILSAYAAVFYLFTPSLAIQATACKNDVGISAVYLLSIAVLLDLLRNGRRESFPFPLLIVLMAQCLGLGIKPYMAFIAPAPILIGLIVLWKLKKEFNRSCFSIFCICLILSSLFLGSYWYIRNFFVFGNPFHPTDFRIGDHLIFGTGDAVQFGPGQRGSASLKIMWDNMKDLFVNRIFDKNGEFNSSLSNISGWGWFNFVCGIPALAYAIVFTRYLRLLVISFILSLIGLFTFITYDPWYMRFTLWFPAIFAVSFVYLLSNLAQKWLRMPLIALAVLCTMLNWIAVLNVGEISLADFKRMVQLPTLARSTAELTSHYDGAYKKTLQVVPENEVIGFCFPNNGWAYPLYDSDLSRRLQYIPIEDAQFTRSMERQSINYLFIERITPEQTQLIQKAVQQGSLIKIEEYLYALKKS